MYFFVYKSGRLRIQSFLLAPLAAKDVSPGGTSATRRQKFHTDDVKFVWNLPWVPRTFLARFPVSGFWFLLRRSWLRPTAENSRRTREKPLVPRVSGIWSGALISRRSSYIALPILFSNESQKATKSSVNVMNLLQNSQYS